MFRIERAGERERFTKSEFSSLKKKNKLLLWHGSRASNFGGILSQGLRIAPPEAPVSGYVSAALSPPLLSIKTSDHMILRLLLCCFVDNVICRSYH